MRINGMQINLEGYHATFDPSFDEIYVPRDVAERIFKNINLQTRIGNENRWVGEILRSWADWSSSDATRTSR